MSTTSKKYFASLFSFNARDKIIPSSTANFHLRNIFTALKTSTPTCFPAFADQNVLTRKILQPELQNTYTSPCQSPNHDRRVVPEGRDENSESIDGVVPADNLNNDTLYIPFSVAYGPQAESCERNRNRAHTRKKSSLCAQSLSAALRVCCSTCTGFCLRLR